ncbi:Other/VPS15 protein kinase [Rhodotorula toruloides ATCC 204091]|uniref:non-specific serine/threonine protein kinase n=2 Tax=Rhodotorula toruloides TaxID=5286 RepID=A0A2T0AIV1_RHOTO|nr:Other/VPS15 protein kinase [Rhodotorula toruloides ATCC 204091]KAK4331513.1 Serine/threonine-protein kinase VPS15 [Rhodotorula toruloides]PRQ77941.1 Other/VPS15 protein kinase [Rhodotorula toruloides]
MGAAVSQPQSALTAAASAGKAQPGADPFFAELGGEVHYDRSMGSSRFLKAVRGRHRQGALVVKVFVKQDPSISLKPFVRRLKAEREALADCPNVQAYGRAIETERAGYLMRQWVASNLYDRISTRPFLSSVEKRWIAFQLLTGLKHARERGISHGDIKTENVVVTSWNWVYLTDFSSAFKPTHLPLDDPSEFSFYFDTSSRRTCYIAPERFYSSDSDIAKTKESLEIGKRDGKITEAMDVFSLGCVLAELWMEGTPPFTLSQLFKYRQGEYSLESYLAEIEDIEIRSLIRSMVSLDPSSRLSFSDYLNQYRGTAFPEIFYTFLHPFLSALTDSASSSAPPPVPNRPGTATPVTGDGAGLAARQEHTLLRTDADDKIERVWTEWEIVARYLDETLPNEDLQKGAESSDERQKNRLPAETFFPIRLHLPGQEGNVVASGASHDGPALVILALVCANIRNCVRPASVLRALEILLALNRYLTDETRLDRLVPYLVTLLSDDAATVRAMALRVLTQTLMLVTTLTPSNVDVFPEYIFPNVRPLANDVDILPRETYALCITPLARTARRFLDLAEALKTEGAFELTGLQDFESSPYTGNFDSRLQELHALVQEHIGPLLTDPSTAVKRALLSNIGDLCDFFGRLKANDAVLAHLVTYLNTRDWLLRKAWNEHAVDVAQCVGPRSLEEYILPLITLSLADPEEFVVVQVLESLTSLASQRLLTKGKIWELVSPVVSFLCHPNIWIREGSALFLSTVASLLEPTDKWCILYPTIKRLLRSDVKEITALSLLDNAREPISRVVFEAAVAWAGKNGKSHFWSATKGPAKGAPRDAGVRTDEDHAQLERLRQLGMSVEDEYKLTAMRDYIAKVASSRQAMPSRGFYSPDALTPSSSTANLQDLGIVPQTIFFSVRSPEEMLNVARSRLQGETLSRRFSSTSATSSPRASASLDLNRPVGSRTVSGQPIEDLRRRLAAGAVTKSDSPASPASIQDGADSDSTAHAPTPKADRLDLHRTVSNASTDASEATTATTATSSSTVPKVRSRIRLNAVEVGKVTAAVAEDSTNAMGLFDVDARYRASAGDGDSVAGDAVSQAPTPIEKGGPAKQLPLPQRLVSTYEGNDPNIKQLLERTYLDSYREPLPELGPHVPPGIPRRKALRTNFPPRERTPNRPEGTLIAHLVEHTDAIVSIQVSPDQLFFVTGSLDGTVKVWDAMRLEKNVTSKSRQTFQQGGKITSVCFLDNSHCIASASTNGSIWIHRVDVSLSGQMPRYSKPQLIRQSTVDDGGHATCLASYNTDTSTNLVFGTSLSSIVVLDIRTMRAEHEFANARHFGPITALCLDRKHLWLVSGTASGVLSVWDLRFGLLLRSWNIGPRRIHQIAVHPVKGKGRWIVVAAEPDDGSSPASSSDPSKPRRSSTASTAPLPGTTVAEVWDIDRGHKVDEFRIVSPQQQSAQSTALANRPNVFANGAPATSSVSMQDASLDPAAAIEALLAASTAPQSTPPAKSSEAGRQVVPPIQPTVRAFLLGTDYSMQATTRPAASHLVALQDQQDGYGREAAAKGAGGKDKDGGFLITGGEDRKLRFWDLGRVSRSAVVSGLGIDEEVPTFSTHTSTVRPSSQADPIQCTIHLESTAAPPSASSSQPSSSRPSRPPAPTARVHRSTLIANSQQQLLRAHQEAITAVNVLDLPFRCVVSGDRAGVVRVFE